MGSIGFRELLIILVVVALLFGTKRLRSLGADLGGAIRGFRKAADGSGLGTESLPPAEANAAHDRDATQAPRRAEGPVSES
jgi:sec-independent protein translocase protein TatA